MTLQAYFDDSGSEPTNCVFVLAGHIAPVGRWARFSTEWAEALAKPPGAGYFKSTEAMNLRGEFSLAKGWDRASRDERVIELAHIIWRHCTVAISAVIRHEDFKDTIQRLPTFGEKMLAHEHPYIFLWYHLLSELWMHSPQLHLGPGPCDFIFDRQLGFEHEALRYWRNLDGAMRKPPLMPWLDWVRSPPAFSDDKVSLPLQAADLWAWSNRRALCSSDDLKLPQEAISRLCALPARHLDFTRPYMIGQARKALGWMVQALKGELVIAEPR